MAIGDYMMSDSKQISFGFDCSYSLRSVDFIKSGYLMNYCVFLLSLELYLTLVVPV